MTIGELITRVLHQLESQFYCDLPKRDFLRDVNYLQAAINTYGFECHKRGWEFDVEFIYGELCRLLTSFKRANKDVTWMPIYLQTAIRQHIREHAEELKEKAKSFPPAVSRIVKNLKTVEVIRDPTPVEIMATVYRDVRKMRAQAAAARRTRLVEQKKQGVLL